MVTNKIKALVAARAKITKLEQAIAAEQSKELATLPAKYGFQDVNAFVKAVKAAAGGRSLSKTKGGKRRKRAIITDDTKNKVKAMTAAGKTGADIAATVGISVPSVQNIKKELGLTKARKK